VRGCVHQLTAAFAPSTSIKLSDNISSSWRLQRRQTEGQAEEDTHVSRLVTRPGWFYRAHVKQRLRSGFKAARAAIEELVAHPPINDAELEQRLAPLDVAQARRALVERLRRGKVSEQDAPLFLAAFEHLGVGGERDHLVDVATGRGDASLSRTLAMAVLAGEDPEELASVVQSLSPEDAEQLISTPLADLVAEIQRDPDQAEVITQMLEDAPADTRAFFIDQLERCRQQTGTAAAATYGHALRSRVLASVHGVMIASVAEEGTPEGIALLEHLRDGTHCDARSRRQLQGMLMRARTRSIDPGQRPEPPAGFAHVRSCDGQGAFVLLGCFESPDGSLTIADICIRAAADVRDGFVVPRCGMDDLEQLMDDLSTGVGSAFAPLSLAEAAEIVADAVKRTQALKLTVPEDARPSVALFERALDPRRDGGDGVEPARKVSLARMRRLVRRPEYGGSWFFDMGDLAGAGVKPPRGGKVSASWIAAAAKKLDTPAFRGRLVAMARHMSRWYAWQGEAGRAGLCAAAALATDQDFVHSPLTHLMLESSLDGGEPAERAITRRFVDPVVRQHLKSLFFMEVTAPRGRDLARLDFTEAALATLTTVLEFLQGERRPREDERYEIAFVIGKAFVESALGAGARSLERRTRRVVEELMEVSQLTEEECLQVVMMTLPGLGEHLEEVCSDCPVACLDRPRSAVARAFFAPRHPMDAAGAGSAAFPDDPQLSIDESGACFEGDAVHLLNQLSELLAGPPELQVARGGAPSRRSASRAAGTARSRPRRGATRRRGRLTRAQSEALKQAVRELLAANPGSGRKQIVEAVDFPSRAVYKRIMGELRESGQLVVTGQRQKTVYSLSGDIDDSDDASA
jgi:hypothetical protein